MSDPAVDLSIPINPVGPFSPPLMPPRLAEASTSELLAHGLEIMGQERAAVSGSPMRALRRTMIVGAHVSMSGDISFCDRLIVGGIVEATLHECRDFEISVGGTFKGNAVVTDADIRGRFEGDLVARKKVIIHPTACVSGAITYGEIEIRSGAEVAGILMPDKKAGTTWLPPAFAKAS